MTPNHHRAFLDYYDRIALPPAGYERLRALRDRVRAAVREYFTHTAGLPAPSFATQGSYLMRTVVKPVSGGNDIDDGVYLAHLGDDPGAWPPPAEVLALITDAVKPVSVHPPEVRRACVVAFGAGGDRADLPVFARHRGKPFVADTGADGWHKSDTIELSEWFTAQFTARGEQLRRIIHYVKGWTGTVADRYRLPSNLILTLYAAEAYEPADDDGAALAATAAGMARRISASWELHNPMEPAELMTRRLTDAQKTDGCAAVCELAAAGDRALHSGDTAAWQPLLGPRFTGANTP